MNKCAGTKLFLALNFNFCAAALNDHRAQLTRAKGVLLPGIHYIKKNLLIIKAETDRFIICFYGFC